MTTLTIYSSKYDKDENVVNGGMSGKAFLDMDNRLGMSFNSMDDSLDYVFRNDIPIDRIEFNYVDENGIQMFRKYSVGQ